MDAEGRLLATRRQLSHVDHSDLQLMPPDDSSDDPYVQVTLELRQSTLVWLDDLRKEWGLHSRGDLVSRLLDELARPTSDE